MKNDIFQRFIKYQDQWLALTPDQKKVIASSSNLNEVVEAAKQKGISRPMYLHIPRWDVNYAPVCRP